MSALTAKLNSGHEIPLVGLGTWQAPAGEVGAAVKTALGLGYRHIDCAAIYGNEAEIGQAFEEVFAQGVIKREDVFITSKLWNTKHKREDVKPALLKQLSDLKLEYLDLYLIHWPMAFTEDHAKDENGSIKLLPIPLRETWEAMEQLVDEGLVRSIGISNFNIQLTNDLLSYARIKPAVNQVELHPLNVQQRLKDFCAARGIHLTGYCPLARSDASVNVMENPTITTLASKYNKSPAAILIRWGVQRGTSVIPKSTKEERLRGNFDVFDFELTSEEQASITALDRKHRVVDPTSFWGVAIFE
eukprot:GILJ01005551.1.p1 GENE.GILJ01005551.1~~GILJ01005551.1.p1  ORF type:complete len:311 (+),score=49.46 GILJ01005551.1:28-933(+)